MASPHIRVSSGDRRLQILEVATELFARQGFSGTTTRQIAQKASVNEAIIFRHFPTKEDLYWAVIENQCQIRGGRARVEELLASGLPDAELLTRLAEEMLTRDVTLTRLLLFSALENHVLSDRFFGTHVARYYELLAEYVRQGIAAGRFRAVDPLLSARALLGMLVYHYHVQEVLGGKRHQQFEAHEVSRTLVDLWLQGMRPATMTNPEAGASINPPVSHPEAGEVETSETLKH